MPQCVIHSGTVAPDYINHQEMKMFLADQTLFINYIVSFGLVKEKVAQSNLFIKRYLPVIMNDYNALASYIPEKEIIDGVDVIILNGREDSYLVGDTNKWPEYFVKKPQFEWFQGNIARCLAFHAYSEVYVSDAEDNAVKEFIRIRDDQKIMLKKIKQQILAFVLRTGKRFEGGKTYWTIAHMKWLKTLELPELEKETLSEYLNTYDYLIEKILRQGL